MREKSCWWENAAIYEIYIRSFQDSDGDGIGDLNGIRMRLQYIKGLGFDAIWISPFFVSPCVDNGYDIADYDNVDPVYGTKEDFSALVNEAHSLGLKVILDMVLNHTSSQHPWFKESISSADSSKRDWYIWRKEINNWGAQFGGSAWHYDEKSGEYYLGLFCADQPDLNLKNPEVRQELKNMMRRWAECGVDGFRLDSISLIAKPDTFSDGECKRKEYSDFHDDAANLPETHEYLHEFCDDVFAPYNLFTIGEAASATVDDALKYCMKERRELSAVLWFEHMGLDGSETYKWTDETIDPDKLISVLLKWQIGTQGKVSNTLFWCNHDQPRIVSKIGDTGKLRERSAKMLAVCLYMMPGIMFVYQGQEIGMTGGNFRRKEDFRDIESINGYDSLIASKMTCERALEIVGKKSRDNARTPMQWSDDKECGFTDGTPWIKIGRDADEITVSRQIQDSESVLNFYKTVISMRKNEECLKYGGFEVCSSTDGIFSYIRKYNNQEMLVLCNMTSQKKIYKYPEKFQNRKIILSNIEKNGQSPEEELLPYECRVIM